MDTFFEVYPDGRLISIIRAPKNWFPSAIRHNPKLYGEINQALDQWFDSAKSMAENKKQYGDRVCLIRFEDLMSRPDAVMRYLSFFLEITFEENLLKPTFNSMPIQPSEGRQPSITDVASGYDFDFKALDKDHRTMVGESTQDDYQTVLREVVVF